MSKGAQILVFTLLGALFGVGLFLTKPIRDIYRIQLEHLEGKENQYSAFWFRDQVDTLPHSSEICRLYSHADTAYINGTLNAVSEVKIYVKQSDNALELIQEISNNLKDQPIRILNYRKQGTIREWNVILKWIVLGFFVGVTFNFIVSRKRNTQQGKQN
jgi:ATP-dependent Zn protease